MIPIPHMLSVVVNKLVLILKFQDLCDILLVSYTEAISIRYYKYSVSLPKCEFYDTCMIL